jgi:hypothetical protein
VRGSGSATPCILKPALVGGKWGSSRPGTFDPGDTALGTHWTGGWAGTGASQKAVTSANPRFLGHLARSPSAIQTELFPGSDVGGGSYKC